LAKLGVLGKIRAVIRRYWITGNRYIVMEQLSKKKNRGIE
jgi:hypothetical protein